MTLSAVLARLWVVAAAIVGMLPEARQLTLGWVLFVVAPVLIVWLGYDYGLWISLFGLFGFVSMFRNPLLYSYRRARGDHPEGLTE